MKCGQIKAKLPANLRNPTLNSSNTSWCSALERGMMDVGVTFQTVRWVKCVCVMNSTYIWDRVTWVTGGSLLRVCSVSWVRWGTVPKCVYSRHPGTSRERCPVLPSPFRMPSRLFPCTTRDNSSFILLPAIRGAAVGVLQHRFTEPHLRTAPEW